MLLPDGVKLGCRRLAIGLSRTDSYEENNVTPPRAAVQPFEYIILDRRRAFLKYTRFVV